MVVKFCNIVQAFITSLQKMTARLYLNRRICNFKGRNMLMPKITNVITNIVRTSNVFNLNA